MDQQLADTTRVLAISGPWLVDTPGLASELPDDKTPDSSAPVSAVAVVFRTEAELIAMYTPLVRQIVGGFQRKLPRNVLRDDLLAAGMSGLWDAVRRQVDAPSDRFEYYVRVRIRGAILDELRAQDWLPRRARAAAAEAQENGNHARAVAPSVVRFDDVSEWEQGRCLATDESSNSEAAVTAKFVKESLARAVDQLPMRERHIVAAHYFRGIKFKDLGTELGVSEPRISQLHSRAMQRLRDLMEAAA
jgi:RNA polymerase sigma factor FliA